MNPNPYQPPETSQQRRKPWPAWSTGLLAGSMLGATVGAVCGLGLAVVHVVSVGALTQSDGALHLVNRGGVAAVAGSLVGLLWGGVWGVIAPVVYSRESSRALMVIGSASSGLLAIFAAMYFHWLVSSGSPLILASFGGACGLVGGSWGIGRLVRVLQSK